MDYNYPSNTNISHYLLYKYNDLIYLVKVEFDFDYIKLKQYILKDSDNFKNINIINDFFKNNILDDKNICFFTTIENINTDTQDVIFLDFQLKDSVYDLIQLSIKEKSMNKELYDNIIFAEETVRELINKKNIKYH